MQLSFLSLQLIRNTGTKFQIYLSSTRWICNLQLWFFLLLFLSNLSRKLKSVQKQIWFIIFAEFSRFSCLCDAGLIVSICHKWRKTQEFWMAGSSGMQTVEFWAPPLGSLHSINLQFDFSDFRKVFAPKIWLCFSWCFSWSYMANKGHIFGVIYFFRYLELVHSLWHMAHFKKHWVYLMILFSWMIGFGYTLPAGITMNKVCFQQQNYVARIIPNFWEEIVTNTRNMSIKTINKRSFTQIWFVLRWLVKHVWDMCGQVRRCKESWDLYNLPLSFFCLWQLLFFPTFPSSTCFLRGSPMTNSHLDKKST